jgi:multicomponent Na+:H+ antiporter subunit E
MSDYVPWPRQGLIWLRLFLVFLREVVTSAATVAWAVVNPRLALTPAIVAVPLDLRTDWRISVLANIVTLTPGTTSLHVSEDLTTLYVHAMDCQDREALARDIKETFETTILLTEPPEIRAAGARAAATQGSNP